MEARLDFALSPGYTPRTNWTANKNYTVKFHQLIEEDARLKEWISWSDATVRENQCTIPIFILKTVHANIIN